MKITQTMLDHSIESLVSVSKIDIRSYDCYGYNQLMTKDGQTIDPTLGDSKKDLYYQIQFYLRIKELEK